MPSKIYFDIFSAFVTWKEDEEVMTNFYKSVSTIGVSSDFWTHLDQINLTTFSFNYITSVSLVNQYT